MRIRSKAQTLTFKLIPEDYGYRLKDMSRFWYCRPEINRIIGKPHDFAKPLHIKISTRQFLDSQEIEIMHAGTGDATKKCIYLYILYYRNGKLIENQTSMPTEWAGLLNLKHHKQFYIAAI